MTRRTTTRAVLRALATASLLHAAPLAMAAPAQGALGELGEPAPLAAHPRDILIPSLPPYAPPLPRHVASEDGPDVYVMADRGDKLRAWVRYPAGNADDPAGKVGVAELLAHVLRDAGSEAFPGDELDAWLARNGAELEIEATLDQFEVRFACPADATADTWQGLLERLASILAAPRQDGTRLERARRRVLTDLAQRRALPAAVAARALVVVAYGADSPYARRPSPESLGVITPADLDAFRLRRLAPRHALVGILGNPSDEAIEQLLHALAAIEEQAASDPATSGDGPPGDSPEGGPDSASVTTTTPEPAELEARPYSGFIQPARTRIWIVDRPGLQHTEVRVAAPGVRHRDPDASALELWSHLVGQGGRANRLGLRFPTLDVSAGFRSGWERPGPFTAAFRAPNAEVRDTLAALIEELTAAASSVTEEDVERIRLRLMNEELFAADTPEKALLRGLDLAWHGYPEDFDRQRILSWRTATPEQLTEAASKRLDPARLVIVAVGPAHLLRESLADLGDLEDLPLDQTLAPGGGQPKEVEALLAAVGGRAAWSDAAAIQAEVDIVLPTREIPSRQWSELAGDRFRAEYLAGGQTVVLVVDGQRAVQALGETRTPLSTEEHQAQLAAKRRSLWPILHRLARGTDLRARIDGSGRLVLQDDQGLHVQLEVGPEGLPTRLIDLSGSEPVARDLSDWSTEGTLAYPRRIVTPSEGIEWRIASLLALDEFSPLLLELGE